MACYCPGLALSTGRQIVAARKLLMMNQADLAKKAGVAAITLRRMEACKGRIAATGRTVGKVADALEKLGVDLIDDHGQLGVVLNPPRKPSRGRS